MTVVTQLVFESVFDDTAISKLKVFLSHRYGDSARANEIQTGLSCDLWREIESNGAYDVVECRLCARVGQFLPPSLLRSQLDTMEQTTSEALVVAPPVPAIVGSSDEFTHHSLVYPDCGPDPLCR